MDDGAQCERTLYRGLIAAGGRKIRRGRFEFLRLNELSDHISADLGELLLREFCQLTDTIYRSDTSHYWASRTDYFQYVDELWVIYLEGDFIGWTGVKWLRVGGRKVLYVDTLNVRPRALRSSVAGYTLGMMLVHEYIHMCFRRLWSPAPCAFRTQNPTVYRLAQAASKVSVFPGIGNEARGRQRSLDVAREIAAKLSPNFEFDSSCSVIRLAYGRSLYGASNLALRAADAEVAEFWRQNLDTAAGDAMVIVVRPTRLEAGLALCRYRWAIASDRWKSALAKARQRWRAAGEDGDKRRHRTG